MANPQEVMAAWHNKLEKPLQCPACEHFRMLYELSRARGLQLQQHTNDVVDENRALLHRAQALFADNVQQHSRVYELNCTIDNLKAQITMLLLAQQKK